ncbi:hypothetical protein N7451_000893 [Penicillium sp. IBT 35674x]|nr:hypothetical protein N7451_000893 [Penicillium sp. IBT 35674x]
MASDTYLQPQRQNYTPVDRYFGTYMVSTLGKYKIRKPHRTGEPSHAGTGIDQVTVLAKVERGKTFSKPPSTHQSDGGQDSRTAPTPAMGVVITGFFPTQIESRVA